MIVLDYVISSFFCDHKRVCWPYANKKKLFIQKIYLQTKQKNFECSWKHWAFIPKVSCRTRILPIGLGWPSFCPKLRPFRQDRVDHGIVLPRNHQSSSRQAAKIKPINILIKKNVEKCKYIVPVLNVHGSHCWCCHFHIFEWLDECSLWHWLRF